MTNRSFIPLGCRCNAASIIKDQIGKRPFSLPFDWIDTNMSNIIKMVNFSMNEFDAYLHQVQCNHQRHPDGTWFPHDEFGENGLFVETIEKYKRRFERFHALLNSGNDLCFLTLMAFTDLSKGTLQDFNNLKDLIILKSKGKCTFITINLSDYDYEITDNLSLAIHHNFHIPLPEKREDADPARDDRFHLWDLAIFDKIRHITNPD